MPPKFKFTREEIVQAALEFTRTEGVDALTARCWPAVRFWPASGL